ncbi:MAG TPA: amidohydrolase family protein [Polyangiaceae bacterium]|nr:amidohydrolase family protein [Polyangiaceae bacterium]
MQAGLAPLDALRAATSVPARAFALQDRGRIAVGLRADLLLVNGDPLRDILATRDIVSIWKLGRRVDRESYRAELESRGRSRKTRLAWFVAAAVSFAVAVALLRRLLHTRAAAGR